MKSVTRAYGSTVDAINFVVSWPGAPDLPWSSVRFGPFIHPQQKSDSSWSRIAERHASGRALRSSATGCPGTTCRRALALRPHLSIGLPLRSLVYNRPWLIQLLPPHIIYLYYTRNVMDTK